MTQRLVTYFHAMFCILLLRQGRRAGDHHNKLEFETTSKSHLAGSAFVIPTIIAILNLTRENGTDLVICTSLPGYTYVVCTA